MRTFLLVALSSALVGGTAGASVALWVAPRGHEKPHDTKQAADGTNEANGTSVEERLANVEQAVRVLERRSPTPLRLQATDAGSATGSGPGRAAAETTSAVDDPVFEAAVRDVIDRAESDRETERELRREDRRKQMATHWADELGPRLGLNDQQKSKLLEIAQQFMSELGRRWERDGGAPLSRSERRAEIQKLREQSEQKLRAVLEPGQMRAYEALSEDDKLGFPRRRGAD